MARENSEAATRVSNWTLATGTQAGHRGVASAQPLPARCGLRNVVVVSECPFQQSLGFLVNTGDDIVVSVESTGHAYSLIKRVQPSLVIVCLEMDDTASFQLLSMLKLDPGTSRIPIVIDTPGPGSERTNRHEHQAERQGFTSCSSTRAT